MARSRTHSPAPSGCPGRPPPDAPAPVRPTGRPARGWLAVLALAAAGAGAAPDFDPQTPDLVVLVDTSQSMAEPGMDPERTSLLVSKLLADLVPGHLAVVRLLDIATDRDLPRETTGQQVQCDEGGKGNVCEQVRPVGDWGALARARALGALERGRRADPGFKERLDAHLAQTSGNSYFFLSFRAAQGVFERHAAAGEPSANRMVVWLSDGRDRAVPELGRALADLKGDGTRVASLVFGRGDPATPSAFGLDPVQVRSPGELMRAFAQVFRQVMRAPYRIDHLVAEHPEFSVKPNIETLWVVVYGDTSLGAVTLRTPDGRTLAADYAADRLAGAGAYRVAMVEAPAAGTWRVETQGGGPRRAYAVIQRSALGPTLLGPARTPAGVETRLEAAVTAGRDPTPVTDPEVLAETRITALIGDAEVTFSDDGTGADARAGDGRFSAHWRFGQSGTQSFELALASPFAERHRRVSIEVTGGLRYRGGELALHFGTLHAPGGVCRGVALPSDPGLLEQQGDVPLEVLVPDGLPAGHRLSARLDGQRLDPGGTRARAPGAPIELCLELDRDAPSSRADGERRVVLRARGGTGPEQELPVRLYWEVQGLGLWERWGWLVLLLLGALGVLVTVLGFILPKRFQPTLAIGFAPERGDLDEYPPQSLRHWRGLGIGFYRNARAFLHPDFRLTGRPHGALVGLYAQGATTWVRAQRGLALAREDALGGWDPVPQTGEHARPGEVYRVGESGPFFRLSAR